MKVQYHYVHKTSSHLRRGDHMGGVCQEVEIWEPILESCPPHSRLLPPPECLFIHTHLSIQVPFEQLQLEALLASRGKHHQTQLVFLLHSWTDCSRNPEDLAVPVNDTEPFQQK